MWLTDGFSVTFLEGGGNSGHIYVSHIHTHESCTATIHGNYSIGEFENSKSLNKGGREHWQPYWISYCSHLASLKMAANQNRKFDDSVIF